MTTITITISTVLLALEYPVADTDGMTYTEHCRIGDAAVDAVQKHLAARYPDAEIEVSWSNGALTRHHVKVATEDGPCDAGDIAFIDVRDDVLEALEAYLRTA